MIWTNEFVELDKLVHDRPSFDCGEVELNEFIQKHAAKHMEIGISTTRVLPASEALPNGKHPVCAFYTIVPSNIDRETLPASIRRKLPLYPVPVFLIAQMAVHSNCQGQGLGKITLIATLKYLWDINEHMRVYAVIVDCLNKGIEGFYSKYEFEVLEYNGDRARMFLPMQTVGMLF